MQTYRLKKLETPQYISVQGRGYWWKQPAYDPYEIVSEIIPDELRIMIHNGLTPDKFVGTHLAASDLKSGGLLTTRTLLPVFNLQALCNYVLASVEFWDDAIIEKQRQRFHEIAKRLEFRGIHPYILDKHKFGCRDFHPN